MRKIFLIVFLLFAFFVESTVQAQTIKEVIEGVPVLPTPTANVPKQSQKWIYIQKEDRKFPDIIYQGVRILLRKSLFGHKINALTIIMLHSCDEKYHLVTII